MTDKPTRRRLRLWLVPLLGVGAAAWVVRSRLNEARPLEQAWQPLPPRPVRPAEPSPVAAEPVAAEPVAAEPVAPVPVPPAVDPEPAQLELPEPEPVTVHARAVPAAAAVASVAAPVDAPALPFGPGSVRAGADGAAPSAEYVVKGKAATRVFYAPGSPYYSRTRADVWFRTDDDARAAGFTPRTSRSAKDGAKNPA